MSKKYHILPLLALLCMAIALGLFYRKGSKQSQTYLEDLYYADVQTNLDNLVEDLNQELARALEHFMAGDSKAFESERAIFFVDNGQISHWTDYHIPFNSKFAEGKTKWQLIKSSQGFFLVGKINIVRHNSFNQILAVVDFYRDYHLSSDYLSAGYNSEIFEDYSIQKQKINIGKGLKIEGVTIWNYKLEVAERFSDTAKVIWFVLFLVGYACLLVYVILWAIYFNKKQEYYWGMGILLLFFLISRGLMLYFGFPQKFYDFKLFDPQVYASSQINASFGDLLLNIFCIVALIGYGYFWLIRFQVYHQLMRLREQHKNWIAFAFALPSTLATWWIQSVFQSIFQNSQVNFDITQSLHFDEVELIYVLIFSCLICVFFLVNHFVLKALHVILRKNKRLIGIHFVVQFILFSIIEFFIVYELIWIPTIILFFLWISVAFDLFQSIGNFQYKTYLYLTLTAMSAALIIAITIVNETKIKDLAQKKRFSEHLILHNDIQGEVIMSEISNHIKDDEAIAANLANGFVKKEYIEETAREKYLSNYFDKYEIHFSYYNKKGMPYFSNELLGNLSQVKTNVVDDKHKTWVDNLYFITNFKKDFFSIYYHFIDLEIEGEYVGTVVIDYTLKKYIAKSILPGLLRLSAVEGYRDINQYDYAIFANNKLQYSVGEFNYNSPQFLAQLSQKKTHGHAFSLLDYEHYLDFGAGKKTIVVSTEIKSFYQLMTNFSFHFLLMVFFLLIFLTITSVQYFMKSKSSDFSAKIQSYLNISTFAPMIMLSILILGLMASSYRTDQRWQFKNNAEILSSHVLGYMEEYKNERIGLFELKHSIDKLSKYSGTDINIYDTQGQLVISNQPLLYEAGVISNLINPDASKEIFDMKHRMVELEENIGGFTYNTVYVALTTPETSDFMGIMSIPFFNSSYDMEQKKISVLAIIINVFAVAFVLLLVVSFFVTKSLTSPLRLIASKLRKVETGSKNEPLYWDSNDELGLLIAEYNQMLQKIEESKQTFAQSQKESAWKEMAQQVAHEIKNPLTPMKLKLQHLKRVISQDDRVILDAIDSLLDQVDTLSEIASSFSSFAKMPLPESKKINLSEVCEHVLDLYENNVEYDLISTIQEKVFVMGDDKLIGRIITNLLLNGIQSVPANRKTLIQIELKKVASKCIFSLKDNGTGIPEEIHNKVFVPNFTTKYTGSGIGLALAKNGIEQMGGAIWFETQEEKGTTFFIELNALS